MSVYQFRQHSQKRELRIMRAELLQEYPNKLDACQEAKMRAFTLRGSRQHLWSRIAHDLDKETGYVRHDLHLTGVRQHVARMNDWRDREITPRWLDWLIVVGCGFMALAAVVFR